MRVYPSRSGSTSRVAAPKATDRNGYQQIIRPSREMGTGLKIAGSSQMCGSRLFDLDLSHYHFVRWGDSLP
jgi:hypothetical protein